MILHKLINSLTKTHYVTKTYKFNNKAHYFIKMINIFNKNTLFHENDKFSQSNR